MSTSGLTAGDVLHALEKMEARASRQAAQQRSPEDALVPWAALRSAVSASARSGPRTRSGGGGGEGLLEATTLTDLTAKVGAAGPGETAEGGGDGGRALTAFAALSMSINGEDVYFQLAEAGVGGFLDDATGAPFKRDEYSAIVARFTLELRPPQRYIEAGAAAEGGGGGTAAAGRFEPLTAAEYGARVYSSHKLRLSPHRTAGASLVFSAPNGAFFTLADVCCCLEVAMRHLGADYSHSYFEGITEAEEEHPVQDLGARYWGQFSDGGGGLIDSELTGQCPRLSPAPPPPPPPLPGAPSRVTASQALTPSPLPPTRTPTHTSLLRGGGGDAALLGGSVGLLMGVVEGMRVLCVAQ